MHPPDLRPPKTLLLRIGQVAASAVLLGRSLQLPNVDGLVLILVALRI